MLNNKLLPSSNSATFTTSIDPKSVEGAIDQALLHVFSGYRYSNTSLAPESSHRSISITPPNTPPQDRSSNVVTSLETTPRSVAASVTTEANNLEADDACSYTNWHHQRANPSQILLSPECSYSSLPLSVGAIESDQRLAGSSPPIQAAFPEALLHDAPQAPTNYYADTTAEYNQPVPQCRWRAGPTPFLINSLGYDFLMFTTGHLPLDTRNWEHFTDVAMQNNPDLSIITAVCAVCLLHEDAEQLLTRSTAPVTNLQGYITKLVNNKVEAFSQRPDILAMALQVCCLYDCGRCPEALHLIDGPTIQLLRSSVPADGGLPFIQNCKHYLEQGLNTKHWEGNPNPAAEVYKHIKRQIHQPHWYQATHH